MKNLFRYVLMLILAVSVGYSPFASAQGARVFMAFQGAYSAGVVYTTNDVVTYGSYQYISIIPNNTGNNPATNSSAWSLFPATSPTATALSATHDPCSGDTPVSSGINPDGSPICIPFQNGANSIVTANGFTGSIADGNITINTDSSHSLPSLDTDPTHFFNGVGEFTPISPADIAAAGDLTNNTSGTASALSSASVLPQGTTATTPGSTDNSLVVATKAYVDAHSSSAPGGTAGAMQYFLTNTTLGGLNGTGVPWLNGASNPSMATSANLQSVIGSLVYDPINSASNALLSAETYSHNASNINTGTVPLANLPGNGAFQVNGVTGALGAAMFISPTCAGFNCPSYNQNNPNFPSIALTTTAALTTTSTTIPVVSTSGWPSAGCGWTGGGVEYFCWDSITSTSLVLNSVSERGLNGYPVAAHASGILIVGAVFTQSPCTSCSQTVAISSTGQTFFGGNGINPGLTFINGFGNGIYVNGVSTFAGAIHPSVGFQFGATNILINGVSSNVSGDEFVTCPTAAIAGYICNSSGVWVSPQSNVCAGYGCTNYDQNNVSFSVPSVTLTAAVTTTSTVIPVSSTTGFPAVGCGWSSTQSSTGYSEYFCWDSITSTSLVLNSVSERGLNGTTAVAMTSGSTVTGATFTLALCPTCSQSLSLSSAQQYTYGGNYVNSIYTNLFQGATRFANGLLDIGTSTLAGGVQLAISGPTFYSASALVNGYNFVTCPPSAPAGYVCNSNGVWVAPGSGSSSGLSRLTHPTKIVQNGDSITAGYGLASPSTTEYGYIMAVDLGLPYYDRAISGDQSCDVWPLQLAPNMTTDQPVQASSTLYTSMIGTNDVDVKGVGSYESVFNTCQQAVLSFLATPAENKIMAGNAAFVNTSGSNSATPVTTSGVTYNTMTSAGVQTATITTTGNPIYVWQLIKDSLSGSFTVSIDGGTAQGPYSTSTTPAISTQNGTTTSVALTGRFSVAAGTHTVAFTWVSGTIGIVGVGSVPSNPYYSAPVIVVGLVPNQGPTGAISTPTSIAQYNIDVTANVALIASDGGDVRIAHDNNYMLATAAEMAGGAPPLHPGPVGHLHLAQAFEASAQAVPIPPASSVLPWSFTTPTGGSTTVGYSPATLNSTISVNYATAMPLQFGIAGALASVSIGFYVTPSGTTPMTVYILTNTTGFTYEVSDSFTVTPTAHTGYQTFYASTDFSPRNVTASEVLATQSVTGAQQGMLNSGTNVFFGGTPTSTPAVWSTSTATLALSATISQSGPPTSNVITLPGMLPSGHCGLPNPANSAAVTNDTAPSAVYVSTVGTGQITLANPAIAGMEFTGICTSN